MRVSDVTRVLSASQPFVNTQDDFFSLTFVCMVVVHCLYCGQKQFMSVMMTDMERNKDMNGQTEGHVGVDGEVFRSSWSQVNSEPNSIRDQDRTRAWQRRLYRTNDTVKKGLGVRIKFEKLEQNSEKLKRAQRITQVR